MTEAAPLIRNRAAKEPARREAVERSLAERKARAAQLHYPAPRPPDQGRTPPTRGLGT